ncbi:hypothetical protein K458DRAFT_370647 [Lentithecium fluviatile CBS 122367]|uniref:Uncharacterized protein n=1 Tax=Lentithecium fluviatile CBS 122367 TaxID=1168545 RepID=A0A6G1IV08_9PLEO|nr:hypothetical protein K458DRAFT_370647 [Lentithecium fluviatile CBS 122367]
MEDVQPGTALEQHEEEQSSTAQFQDEESSLFIPEVREATLPPPQTTSSRILPLLTPPPRPTARPLSTFAKIRSLQQKIQKSKAAANKPQYPYRPMPDEETYLEAAQAFGVGLHGSGIPQTMEGFDSEDKIAAAEYQKQKGKYDQIRLENNGKLSFREDVEWMKIEQKEKARREKRKRDMQKVKEDNEPDLFPDIHGLGINHEELEDDIVDLDPSDLSGRRKRPAMPRKPEKNISIQEAELQSMRVALDAEPDLPRKKRKGSHDTQEQSSAPSSARSRGRAKGSRSKTTGRPSRGPSGGTGKRVRKSAKKRKETEVAVRQATSLFIANVFQQQAEEDAPEEPSFRSRNKQDALKELIASVPTDALKAAAKGDTVALMNATKDFDGRSSVKADGNGMWRVKGMLTSLKAYQIMGTAFMRRRENAPEEPKGGLLADQMGLGKTLMMLANIVNGHSDKHPNCKTTLLIASQALITQWSREIELHTNAGFRVMKYTASSRIDSNCAEGILKSHDIILTTYTEIMKSYPRNEPPIDCQTAEQKIAWWKTTYDTERGALHRMMFYRVVLDEAQAIKNHTSRTSIACRALMAKHKWALSGTPILNSLTELYPYFKFLGVPHTGSFKIFKHNYCATGNAENQERLLVRLSQFMIRRTHGDILFGAPILKLPRADQMTYWCEFNPVERSIYDIVRQRFAKHINMWAKKGELEKSYSNALVMLLRLRQLTAHVLMLQYVMQDLLEREDIEQIRDVISNAAGDSTTTSGRTILAIRKQLDDLTAKEKKRAAANNSKSTVLDDEDDLIAENDVLDEEDAPLGDEDGSNRGNRCATGAQFGNIPYNFKPFLGTLTTGDGWKTKKQRSQCGSCGQSPPIEPWQTSCGHLLCNQCYEEASMLSAEEGKHYSTCNGCGKIFAYARRLSGDDLPEIMGPETRAKRRRHNKEREKIEQQDISDDWLNLGGPEGVLPSAKTIAIKAQILNWLKENPSVKIIIYTQFLAMIRILAKMCQEEGWETEQYHGKLSFGARDKAIGHFADNPNVRVLLASLRCGGLGLNLTMASRVIVIDPWWNSAAEQQAFCRVFRFGQRETTFLTKFCVRNTVDERLIQMQEKKQKEIDEVMEDKNKTATNMSVRDLMRLFGNIQEDSNGTPFIVVDNPSNMGGFRADRDDEGYADDH